jgi:transglutaminase-like putative cysteine protease/Flp pilus assembly protein TadD
MGTIAGIAIAMMVALGSAHASAQRGARGATKAGPTVWERDVDRLRAEVLRRGRHASAIVPLVELGSSWEHAPARTVSALHALGSDTHLSPTVRAYARGYERTLLARQGDHQAADALAEELGMVRAWRILGPFDNDGRRGFDTTMPPEEHLDAPTALTAEVQGAERPIHWRTLPDLTGTDSVVLGPFLTPSTDVCAFAETFVELDRARPVTIVAGATGALRVWWNGARVIEDGTYRTIDLERDIAIAAGRGGWNRVLVKVCGASAGAAFLMRVGEADGLPMRVHADPDGATVAAAAPATAPTLPAAPSSILAELEHEVEAHPSDAAATEALARYLGYTHGADATEHRVRDLAQHATELHATVENLLFAADQQTTRRDRSRLVMQAVALAPTDPRVQLAHASLVVDGAAGERALAMLEAIPMTTTTGFTAAGVRARLLDALGLDDSAFAIVEAQLAAAPGAPAYLRTVAEMENGRGHVDRSLVLRRQLLAIRADDTTSRHVLVDDAVARGAHDEAVEMVRTELAMHPTNPSTMSWASGIYDALSMETEAVDALHAETELDPDDATSRVALGQLLLRLDRRDAALASLREALALRPQDASTRMLIEQIQPEERPDEAYATAMEEILGRRRPDGQWQATILHDLEVHTVHESGLSSRFRQLVIQIHDDQGARANRSHAIYYEPSTQWVDVRAARVFRGDQILSSYSIGEHSLAEPQYRIYYSAREVVVTLPVLEPGDVVELRYRVEDVAARNQFADYFGNIRGLAAGVPTVRMDEVFLVPASRTLHFNVPTLALAHEEQNVGDTHVIRYTATDVPAIHSEPGMPGYTEVSPYLHASTFRTWEEVGRFWWGLAAPQLVPDADLERTVHQLVDDAPDERTKVARIYAWATDHVRYVGLELGIHGHQPYRVADVVQRGFGDCKDTASLLYAMLQIAGIDARIALVRTTRNGDVDEAPASLAVFDHAIAYVPSLDLFLDGTAEHGGIGELPSGDQGALTLVVGPSSAELRHIPVRAPESAGREREITIALTPTGGATLSSSELLMGSDAMAARGSYEAPETREQRLQSALGAIFPSIELDAQSFANPTEREQPMRYTWSGHVPQLGERDGTSVRVPPSVLGGLVQSTASLATRTHPLQLGPPFHYRERRTITVPAGLSLTEVPPGGVAESPFGRLAVSYARSGQGVLVDTQYETRRTRIDVGDYAAYRAWCEQADALLRARVVIGGVR